MKKELILSRLDATINKLEELKEEQFAYKQWVSEYKTEGREICGTVCCVAGWYPQWFPEATLLYQFNPETQERPTLYPMHTGSIKVALRDYHGVRSSIINILFYGVEEEIQLLRNERDVMSTIVDQFPSVKVTIFDYSCHITTRQHIHASLFEVIELFKCMYELIEADLIVYSNPFY